MKILNRIGFLVILVSSVASADGRLDPQKFVGNYNTSDCTGGFLEGATSMAITSETTEKGVTIHLSMANSNGQKSDAGAFQQVNAAPLVYEGGDPPHKTSSSTQSWTTDNSLVQIEIDKEGTIFWPILKTVSTETTSLSFTDSTFTVLTYKGSVNDSETFHCVLRVE
jgi:hypothetical protein